MRKFWMFLVVLTSLGWLVGAALLFTNLDGLSTIAPERLIGTILLCMVLGSYATFELGSRNV